MADQNQYPQHRGMTGIKTFMSTRRFYGLSLIDWGWVGHIAVGITVAYQAFNGINLLASLGLDAPLYKVGIVTVAEVARAVLSIANVWEEEINWLASTVLVLVLISNGGGDIGRISEVTPSFTYNANVAQPVPCTWKNIKSGATLNDAEIQWCKETSSKSCACN